MGAHLGLQGCGRPFPHPRGGPQQRHLAAQGWSAGNDDQAGKHAGRARNLLTTSLIECGARCRSMRRRLRFWPIACLDKIAPPTRVLAAQTTRSFSALPITWRERCPTPVKGFLSALQEPRDGRTAWSSPPGRDPGARDCRAEPAMGRTENAEAELIHKPVQLRGVVANDLAACVLGQMAELALDVFLRVGPDAIGVREIRAPHDVVLAELVEQFHADRVALVGGVALAPPVFAGPHLQ